MKSLAVIGLLDVRQTGVALCLYKPMGEVGMAGETGSFANIIYDIQ